MEKGNYIATKLESISNEEYYGKNGYPASIKSLSYDFENDFLKENKQVISFSGGNGIWKVKIGGNYNIFRDSIFSYGKSRIYMHFNEPILLNGEIGDVLISLLGL